MNLLATTIDLNKEAARGNLPGAGSGSAQDNFGDLFGGLMSGVMAVAAMLVFFYLIWGAIEWITSGSDKSKTESARNKITQAIVGLIVLAATTAIFAVLQNFLDICVLDFGGSC